MQADGAMANAKTKELHQATPVCNEEFAKVFDGSKKLKNASFLLRKNAICHRQRVREAENTRCIYMVTSGPLYIATEHGTTWLIDTRKGTSHALAFADHFYTLHPHPDALKLPLPNFHPLYIDRLWHMIHYDWYTMGQAHRLDFVEEESKKEDPSLDMTHKPKAELHFWMVILADTVRYADLKTFAIGELQHTLIKEEILNASAFIELISQLFRPEMLNVVDEDRSLRLVMATYGAFCDPVWRQQQPDVYEILTRDNGPDSYGYWHQKAHAALPGVSKATAPEKIRCLLEKSDALGSEMQASDLTMHTSGMMAQASGATADASISTENHPRPSDSIPTRARASVPPHKVTTTRTAVDAQKGFQSDHSTGRLQPSKPTRRQTKMEFRDQKEAQTNSGTIGQLPIRVGGTGYGTGPLQSNSTQTTTVGPAERETPSQNPLPSVLESSHAQQDTGSIGGVNDRVASQDVDAARDLSRTDEEGDVPMGED